MCDGWWLVAVVVSVACFIYKEPQPVDKAKWSLVKVEGMTAVNMRVQ